MFPLKWQLNWPHRQGFRRVDWDLHKCTGKYKIFWTHLFHSFIEGSISHCRRNQVRIWLFSNADSNWRHHPWLLRNNLIVGPKLSFAFVCGDSGDWRWRFHSDENLLNLPILKENCVIYLVQHYKGRYGLANILIIEFFTIRNCEIYDQSREDACTKKKTKFIRSYARKIFFMILFKLNFSSADTLNYILFEEPYETIFPQKKSKWAKTIVIVRGVWVHLVGI